MGDKSKNYFFIFCEKKSLWGGVNLIFGEKVAVSEGTFGAIFFRFKGDFEKNGYYRRE